MYSNNCDNPFIAEAILSEIDPLYAATAEYADMWSFFTYNETADIKTYVEAHWMPTYKSVLKEAIEEGRVPVNRKTQKVPRPTAASVTSCELKWLETFQSEKTEDGIFYIDAIISTEIEIFQPEDPKFGFENRRELLGMNIPLRTDHVRQWYRIRGIMDIVGSESDIAHSIMIYDKRDKRQERPLTDRLIPRLSCRDMEVEAQRILLKHKMKSALTNVHRVSARKLAEKMKLTVIPARLSKNGRIRGMLYLHDASVKIYKEDGTEDHLPVKARTILYDPRACGTSERIDETIMHECIHYEEHYLYYKLQRDYNDCLEYLASIDSRFADDMPEDTYEQWLEDEVVMGTTFTSAGKWKPIEWVEWQARELTPRLKMPADQTKKKIIALSQKYSKHGKYGVENVYEHVIPDLARFYGVSWTTAKKRMIELGFPEARGARIYVDGKYIPPFNTTTRTIESGTSYVISRADAQGLYNSDPLFASVIDSGRFVYAEGHYCLDEEKFVYRDAAGIHLTIYARQNINECSLLFKFNYNRIRNLYDKEAFHSDDRRSDPIRTALAAIPLELLIEDSKSVAEVCTGLPRKFHETLRYHRKQGAFSQEKLAEILGVDSRQIGRWENNEAVPTRCQIAAMGILMGLKGQFTEDLMNKAKVPINMNDEEDMNLRFVIYYMYMRPLEDANQVMVARGFEPLAVSQKKVAKAV